MALEIFRLVGSVFVDTDAAEKSLNKTDKSAAGLGKTLLEGASTVAKWGAGVVAAAGACATALYGVTMNAASAMDEIDKGSAKIGISKQAYQEWSYVLGQNGMDIGKLETGMKSLVSAMDGAASGTKSAQGNFDSLGLSIYDSSGALKDQETMLNETLYALANMENGTEKARLATELFGKAGVDMMPMLNNGAKGMAELTKRAHELGVVIPDEAVTAGVLLGDTMADVKQSFTAVINKIGVEFMPVIQRVLDWVLKHMPEIQNICSTVFTVIGNLVSWVSGTFQTYMPQIQNFVENTFEKIKNLWLTDLKPIFDAIVTLIKEDLAPAFMWAFEHVITPVVSAAFDGIGQLWTGTLMPVLNGILDFITGVFTLNFEQAFSGLVTAIGGVWDGLTTVVKTPINAVIGIINQFIGGLNNLKFPDWVPEVGGKGINISTIPYLQEGAVLEKGQVGFLEGNGAEAVVPLHKNKKWISAVAEDMSENGLGGGSDVSAELLNAFMWFIAALPEMLTAALENMRFEVNNREFARLVKAVK